MNSTFELLSGLERFSNSRAVEVEPLNPASLIWFRIQRAYQDEKRKKKLRDMENKPQVFTLVRRTMEDRKPRYSFQYQKNLISPQIQDNPMHAEDVNSLIRILKVVYKTCDVPLLEECILRKIAQLRAPEDVLATLRRFLYCPIYIKGGLESYKAIEQRMIKIVLNTNRMEYCNPAKVVQFVRSLPFISENTLELLSFFLEEISDPEATELLYEIFMKWFPAHPSEEKIRYLIRVSNLKAVDEVYNLTEQGLISFDVLQDEAKSKLKKVPKQFNERGKAMLKFVFFVTAHGGSIWTDIIEWEKTAPVQYKNYLKDQAQNIVKDSSIKFDYLLVILMKLTDINYESEIADIFFNHVINLNSRQNKSLLNTLIVRKFLSSKLLYKLNILKEKNLPFKGSSLEQVFNKDMSYSDVLLELFQNDVNSKAFYSYFLESDANSDILIDYLSLLKQRKKAKFKTFFVKCLNNSGNLLDVGDKKLLKYFLQNMPLELSYAAIKEMSCRSPATYYMLFLIHWLRQFRGKPNYSFLRACIIRNLNLVLIRTDLQLSTQFLHDFNKMRKEELSPDEAIKVMADIPKSRREAIDSSSH